MKPVEAPKNNMYVKPPDSTSEEELGYVVVQISKIRYVVCQYFLKNDGVLHYQTVSRPMRYEEALSLSIELREDRRKTQEGFKNRGIIV